MGKSNFRLRAVIYFSWPSSLSLLWWIGWPTFLLLHFVRLLIKPRECVCVAVEIARVWTGEWCKLDLCLRQCIWWVKCFSIFPPQFIVSVLTCGKAQSLPMFVLMFVHVVPSINAAHEGVVIGHWIWMGVVEVTSNGDMHTWQCYCFINSWVLRGIILFFWI